MVGQMQVKRDLTELCMDPEELELSLHLQEESSDPDLKYNQYLKVINLICQHVKEIS